MDQNRRQLRGGRDSKRAIFKGHFVFACWGGLPGAQAPRGDLSVRRRSRTVRPPPGDRRCSVAPPRRRCRAILSWLSPVGWSVQGCCTSVAYSTAFIGTLPFVDLGRIALRSAFLYGTSIVVDSANRLPAEREWGWTSSRSSEGGPCGRLAHKL
jgi:hypothetical protein